MYKERYLITGGSGFIGTQLIRQLLLDDHEVTVLTRNPLSTSQHFNALMNQNHDSDLLNPPHYTVQAISELDSLSDESRFDVVINLAGQGIADKRWSDQVKQQLIDSRIKTTRSLYDYINRLTIKPDVFISGSALGYYGLHDDDQLIDENGEVDDSFSSQLCQLWEQEATKIEKLGVRTCYLRTGVVLGKEGGALKKMLPPFKFGLGGPIGDGKQWMSWIHMEDLVGIIRFAVEQKNLHGPINGTAPNPVTNKTFSRVLGRVLNRPAFLPVPAFVMKLLLGQMGEELLLSGQRVIPRKAMDSGFEFKYAELENALCDVIK